MLEHVKSILRQIERVRDGADRAYAQFEKSATLVQNSSVMWIQSEDVKAKLAQRSRDLVNKIHMGYVWVLVDNKMIQMPVKEYFERFGG